MFPILLTFSKASVCQVDFCQAEKGGWVVKFQYTQQLVILGRLKNALNTVDYVT